ncbi:MAG TPA: YdcF family protein [Longimicrobiales bacterium]|mgnify:CR=1 FL=1|nr:YdcF family protein [Longimicrobiales bacterium]
MLRKGLRWFGIALGGAFTAWVVIVALVLLAGATPSIRNADVILVLGAAQYNGRPSPVLRARLDHALELYRQGYAERILVTGGVGVGDTLSEGEVARRYAVQHGVPDSVILVENEGLTSAESVNAAAELMRARGLRTALVVSDPFHMLRLEVLARRAGITPFRAPAPSTPIAQAPRVHWRYVLRESLIVPVAALFGGR